MARPEHIFVFCYDIRKDSVRRKVADMLEADLARVQFSVYEGRMTADHADWLGTRTGALLEDGDSLRVYAVTAAGLKASFVKGPHPLPEPEGYYIL
jgi:CRISPR-associated protein Cas2